MSKNLDGSEQRNMKVAFLDRDGTIVKDYADEEWTRVNEPEFLNGSIKGLEILQSKGYELIVITNQYIINDGYITFEQYHDFTNKMLSKLRASGINILDIFYCEHSSSENCSCKKPKNGMYQKAINKYEKINRDKSIMIGDSNCDKGFAEISGLRFYGLKGGSLINQKQCYDSIEKITEEII